MSERIMKKRPKRPQLEDEYKVGYGKPPKHTQFKSGQSGNPKGRPKNSKNSSTILEKELSQRVSLREGDHRITITKWEAIIKQLLNKAMGGNLRASEFIYKEVQKIEDKDAIKEELLETISEDDQKIIDRYFERRKKNER